MTCPKTQKSFLPPADSVTFSSHSPSRGKSLAAACSLGAVGVLLGAALLSPEVRNAVGIHIVKPGGSADSLVHGMLAGATFGGIAGAGIFTSIGQFLDEGAKDAPAMAAGGAIAGAGIGALVAGVAGFAGATPLLAIPATVGLASSLLARDARETS